ncbi:set and mynd domain containing, putative [Schistosoma mansoni]|uniref:set and mynd domain containing, putative n=1 Tax=Schistosoma mansoni TaxID=6183 RepID=UPI0001A630EC|nr:set and mynd domain containing, putative [Schistosoma mansoni]|eukprot:XP_018646503.1 set and mynd domain containing, putative [Schistosoma mansoni]
MYTGAMNTHLRDYFSYHTDSIISFIIQGTSIMDTDIDHHHIKSTESNHVSTLWTKLISMELNYVHKNRQLSLHLLNKQIDHSNKIKKLAIQANSTELSASFYYRIVNYINENATNDLRRIIPFINELNMGNICMKSSDIIAVEPAGGWAANRNAHSYHSNNNDRNTFEYLLLLPSQRMNQCLKCFSQLNSVGFVCPYCCDAAYCELSNRTSCNSYCAEISNPSYLFRDFQQLVWHLAECRFMFLLNSMGLGHLCFRLAWLRQHYHHPSADENIDNNPFFTTDQLVEHFTNFHVDELFEYALTGWLISKILNCSSNNDNNKTNLESTNNELIQGLWCFDTLRRLQCNAHAITEIEVNDSDIQTWFPSDQINVNDANDLKLIYPFICKFQQIRIATGLFPCVSLLNHSCDPNTAHNFEESFLILRCLKPILPGTEVFHCYGPHYLHYPSSVQRVTLLQQQYFFICDCEHCSKPVQSLSLSTSITDQQMSVVPANEMLIEWKDTADKAKGCTLLVKILFHSLKKQTYSVG